MAIARRGLFAILLSATLALAGCIMLPIPTSEDKVLAGTQVAEAQLTFVEPGVTTQAEVVERLGQPALVWEDARVFVYQWDMRQGILVWAVGAHVTGAAGKTDLPSHHQLLIRFDEGGRVQRFEHRKRPSGVSVAQSIREWLGLPVPGDEPLVVDESGLAAALLATEAPQAGPPRSVLMQRWRPGEPLVFRSPLPSPSVPSSAPSSPPSSAQ